MYALSSDQRVPAPPVTQGASLGVLVPDVAKSLTGSGEPSRCILLLSKPREMCSVGDFVIQAWRPKKAGVLMHTPGAYAPRG